MTVVVVYDEETVINASNSECNHANSLANARKKEVKSEGRKENAARGS